MATFNCPSCATPIEFKSSVSIYAVCPSCASMVVRKDKDVEIIGSMAELPEEITPFQIGTGGRYKNLTFTIIGRARMAYSEGFWNEWFLYMDDGSRAWLAEAQGNIAICFETETKKRDQAKLPRAGEYMQINKKRYLISDIKEAECIGSEGELPFEAGKGRKATYVDMLNENGEFASIEFYKDDQRVFTGEYMEFSSLHFNNLRELDGWKYNS